MCYYVSILFSRSFNDATVKFVSLKLNLHMHFISSIVKVRGQISLLCGGSIIFGLSDYPVSEFELVAEELLMSDSIIKASFYTGAF